MPRSQSPVTTRLTVEPLSAESSHRTLTPDRAGLAAARAIRRAADARRSTRVVGSTDATRGCKHLCRHCPIVPVYNGRFRAVPDRRRARRHQRAGRTRARSTSASAIRISSTARRTRGASSSGWRAEFPGVTYDVTIKIEHLLTHATMLPVLARHRLPVHHQRGRIDRRPGAAAACEGAHARGFHQGRCSCAATRASRCRRRSSPSRRGRRSRATSSCCGRSRSSISWSRSRRFSSRSGCSSRAVRRCSSCPTSRRSITEFDPASLTWPWRHRDPRVDALQQIGDARSVSARSKARRAVPHMTEAWYCCAEPSRGGHATGLKRVLLLATTTGYQIRSFGEAAEKLGVRLVFASDRCDQLDDPWWDQAIPVRFHDELGIGRRRSSRRFGDAASGRHHRGRRSSRRRLPRA